MSENEKNDSGIDAAKLKAAEDAAAAKKAKTDEAAAAKAKASEDGATARAKAAEDAAAKKTARQLTAKTRIRVGGETYEAGEKLPDDLEAEVVAELKVLNAV